MSPFSIDLTTSLATPALSQERLIRPTDPLPAAPPTGEDEVTEAKQATREALVEPIQRINDVMRPRGLEFDISEESTRIITRVIDRETGDVIRQIPAEEVLLMAEQLEALQGKLISLEA
ncbi:flagellar protein FlaG [Vreelandella lutescens]|uniref:Flagellar protein FlaG n=1 Tax=Vreelandella lutescens TaxID=1602943 RepID=A0ABQ1PFJ0_9GAMM|nr:flagellar protein FlaG [Halomonas lutescens]GGC96231.1 flagellar protein FlaG [Halomonas lutescens]